MSRLARAAGGPLAGWIHPDDRAEVVQALAALTAGAPFNLEYRLSIEGGERWVQDRGRATAQAGRLWIDGVLVDATPERMVRQELARLALHDPLTGLPNRMLALDRLKLALAQARRESTLVGVMFLDLDNFKHINDTLGHDAGDNMLIEAARRISSCLRGTSTVARLGGDEFLVILPGLTGLVASS